MNDDMLSQEEINELLKSVEGDDGEEESELRDTEKTSSNSSIDDYLDPIQQDALGEIGNISFGSAATALSELLGQKVEITTPTVSIIKYDELDEEFPQPHVAVHVKYTEGFEGTNLLVIHSRDAAIIADLMLGGDGSSPSEELDDMHISAVQEAMNQMMGSASTSMSTVFNKRVDISPPGIDMLDVKKGEGTDKLPDEDNIVQVAFRLKIGDLIDSSLMQLLSIPFATQMVSDLMNPETEVGLQMEEPVAAPEPTPPAPDPTPPPKAEPVMEESPKEEVSQRPTQDHASLDSGKTMDATNKRVQPAAFASFDTPSLNESEARNLEMLLDIPLEVTVELGRTKRSIGDILEFTQGSIIELDKLAGEPVDILVNQKLIAKGEVVVIDENFGVRVTDIVSRADRIKHLKQ